MESLRSGKPWEFFARPSFSADRPAIPRLRDAFLHILTRNMIYFSQILSFSQKKWEIMSHEFIYYIWWSVDYDAALCGVSPPKPYDFTIKLKWS